MAHWAATLNTNGEMAVYKNGVALECQDSQQANMDGKILALDRPSNFIGKSNWRDQLF